MIKRLIQPRIEKYLEDSIAVLLTGPKYCGKTYLAERLCKSAYFVPSSEEVNKLASYSLDEILEGPNPRLIDEWQRIPVVWNAIKDRVDHKPSNEKHGAFILTGSTRPPSGKHNLHNGAGRFYRISMGTLSFAEILDYDETKSISLTSLVTQPQSFKVIPNPLSHDEVNQMMLDGGWPAIYSGEIKNKDEVAGQYVQSVVEGEVAKDNLRWDETIFRKILISLARLNGSQLNRNTIIADLETTLNDRTLLKYLDILYTTDVIFDLEMWTPVNFRSKYKMRTKPKTYFCDTSLICSLLNITSTKQFYQDMNITGILFENQVIKDLKVYAQSLGAQVFYFRDEKGHEIDAIMQFKDGQWWAIEIKLSYNSLDKAIENLNNIAKLFDNSKEFKEPALKLIITDTNSSMKINDKFFIIPHTLIRP